MGQVVEWRNRRYTDRFYGRSVDMDVDVETESTEPTYRYENFGNVIRKVERMIKSSEPRTGSKVMKFSPDVPIVMKDRHGRDVVMSRKEISRRSGIAAPYVSKIFSGQRRPSLMTAAKLAQCFDTTIDIVWANLPNSPSR